MISPTSYPTGRAGNTTSSISSEDAFNDFLSRSDNDQYSHMNNSIYYHLFDSIVNTYLIQNCGQNPQTSPSIGLVISSWCQFFAPLSFPDVLDLGLRVTKLGNSSVTYEVGVFKSGEDTPSAVGGYAHVFVEREKRRSVSIGKEAREGLRKLLVDSSRRDRDSVKM